MILFLATLNRWVSLAGLPFVNLFTDPNAIPPLTAPLYFLLTYPIHWLPGSLQTTALNVLSAILGAMVVLLLARSVTLLPQDRTRDQRHRLQSDGGLLSVPLAWVPPVFAGAVCAFQLSFWENATAATSEMVGLLVFAYVVRNLLEYRCDGRESWLTRLSFVCGLGIANGHGMIGYFPLLLVALVWMMGKDFFDLRFLVRMFLWGSAGLVLYLVLPLVFMTQPVVEASFWQILKAEMVNQKNSLIRLPRYLALFGALTSLLPLAFIGIRWPSAFGDISAAGIRITNIMLRVVHLLFFVFCLWTIFDAPFSTRTLVAQILASLGETHISLPLLSFHYLCALSLGYLAGYHLLVYGQPEKHARRKRASSMETMMAKLGTVVVLAVSLVAVAALIVRNYPTIRANDGSLLRQYAEHTLESLPKEDCVLLSDRLPIQALVQTLANQQETEADHLFVNTGLLSNPRFQKQLHRRAPDRWPEPPEVPSGRTFSADYIMLQVGGLAASNTVCYLHPSFGYFFEPLYAEPHNLATHLKLYPLDGITPPPLESNLQERNETFWREAWSSLEKVSGLVARNESDARVVGRWYSRALNTWGVTLQRTGDAEAASKCFEMAVNLNPDNVVAEVNRDYNRSVRDGTPKRVELGQRAEDAFGKKFRTWTDLLAQNGPIDEPGFCARLAAQLSQQSLFRQAAHQYLRVREFEPDNIQAALDLADIFLIAGLFDRSLEVTRELNTTSLSTDEQAEVVRLQSVALFRNKDEAGAEQVLKDAYQKHPDSMPILEMLIQFYQGTDRLEEARTIVARQLELAPDHPRALLNQAIVSMKTAQYEEAHAALKKILESNPNDANALLTQSALFIQTKDYDKALPILDRMLGLNPDNQPAMLNRAIARLQSGQLEEAKQDYEILLERTPSLYSVYYGLGEIARRQNKTEEALRHYDSYLMRAPAGTEERAQVEKRMAELKSTNASQ